MARWLEIDSNNVVKNCVVTPDGVDANWCAKNLGFPQNGVKWMEQTAERGGGIGDTYIPAKNWFKSPAPFTGWIYNDTTNEWSAPFMYTSNTYMKDGVATVYSTINWDNANSTWLATTSGAIADGPYGYAYLWNNNTSTWDLKP